MRKGSSHVKDIKLTKDPNLMFQDKIVLLENEQAELSNELIKKQNELEELILENEKRNSIILAIKRQISIMEESYLVYSSNVTKFKDEIQRLFYLKEEKISKLQTGSNKLKRLYDETKLENIELENKLSEQLVIKDSLELELKTLNETVKKKYWANSARLSLAQQIELANQEILSWKYRLQKQSILVNDVRRRLFNELQDIRGNIRVFCRVRPPRISERESCIEYDISEDSSTITIKHSNSRGLNLSTFKFDYIFLPQSTQEEIFEEVSQLVQSALDGYNVCLFSYGQTGSGKTFTMIGRNNEAENGMIPRAISLIFEMIEINREKGWVYDIECSAIEIYNENIRDLTSNKKISEVKIDQSGSAIMNGINSIRVTSICEVNKLLKIAQKNRVEACTKSNERSSRSHSIFQLKISGEYSQNTNGANYSSRKIVSILSLIDLAGSERVNKSGVAGERLKETQFINKSLSALGDVIMSINLKKDHIPFRNSKLTMILKNCLGGNSKTTMLVHISPCTSSINETISSLRFASKVQNCYTNRKNMF
ncbi:kinesin-domain-containing protein [Cryptosporidium felis]|nr:kinesin-domain-containing protein [Cryptosporidium felis]